MNINRLTAFKYTVFAGGETFILSRLEYSVWLLESKPLKLYKLCDDLAEALDYIDFIMSEPL